MIGEVPLHPHILIRFQIQKSEIEIKVRSTVFFFAIFDFLPIEGRLRPSLEGYGIIIEKTLCLAVSWGYGMRFVERVAFTT